MEMTNPNFVAIIVMAVIYMGLGWLWYSPKLFGNMVACSHKSMDHNVNRDMNKTECSACCWTSYVGEFVLACIMGYVLFQFIIAVGSQTITTGLQVGFLAWLGFVATTMFSKVLWTHKPIVKFFICSGFYLVMLPLMGAAFSVWR